MQLTSIFTVLAAGLSFVAATEDTTTSTSTMTKTVTITQCNPTATNCPAEVSSYPVSSSSSSSVYVPSYPAYNSTSAGPTAYPNVTVTYAPTTSYPAATETSVIPTAAPTSTNIPASGARGLFVQSGLLMGVLGAGIALLA